LPSDHTTIPSSSQFASSYFRWNLSDGYVAATFATVEPPVVSVPGRDAPVDLFDHTSGTSTSVQVQHDLPTTLTQVGAVQVEHGTDPGDFYCEHAFFTQQRFASEVGVQKNAFGEPLCGFLHVPTDAECSAPADANIKLAQR
jgi:hypothetical protein